MGGKVVPGPGSRAAEATQTEKLALALLRVTFIDANAGTGREARACVAVRQLSL